MNRHRTYGEKDETPTPEGDGAFLGVNARLHPNQLSPGEVASAINARFDEGRISTRKGVRIMAWGAQTYADVEPGTITPYGSVILAESFSDPFGYEWLIIVTETGVYRTRQGATGLPISLPPGEGVTGATDLIQTYNGMVMLRGADADPLYMTDVDSGWRILPAADSGLEALPKSTQGIYFQNRLFTVDARTDAEHRDSVWVSDFGATSSVLQGELAYQSFKINQGSADRLVALAKFNDTTLIAAKERSIYVVSNIYGDNSSLATNARLDEVTRQYGCRAARSFVQVGADLWFLAHRRGICSIRQTETNALQGVDIPVSRDIQPLIDRINWEHAGNSVAAVHENRVFFAVPLDNSTYNNAILVYSTLTQKWAGYDTSTAIKVKDFVQFTYGGVVRQGWVSTDGFVCLYEDGYTDEVGDESGTITAQPIATTVRTRGYGGGSSGWKRFTRTVSQVLTWNTSLTITSVMDGRGETASVTSKTVDNTRYLRPHGKAAWSADNDDDDWDTAFRDDYAVEVNDMKVTATDGTGTVAFDILQEKKIENYVNQKGQYMQLEYATTRGRMEIAGVVVDLQRARATQGVEV